MECVRKALSLSLSLSACLCLRLSYGFRYYEKEGGAIFDLAKRKRYSCRSFLPILLVLLLFIVVSEATPFRIGWFLFSPLVQRQSEYKLFVS
ncbi:hypothetical protein VNO80_07064 [Phaseolus coccineus]|uniref:Uncharacterized protein n=1 Tax=Phaseolus coccineus TaxID=3886 RepID=A0AAN9NI10_PHACN